MKRTFSLLALVISLGLLGCAEADNTAGFSGGQRSVKALTEQSSDATTTQKGSTDQIAEVLPAAKESEDAIVEVLDPTLTPSELSKPSLSVILPAPQLRLGGQTIQALAKLSTQAEAPAVRWEVSTASSLAPGLINETGVYISPQQGAQRAEYDVTITAIWLQDETVTGSATLKLIPVDQIFVGCMQDSKVFPIKADVYKLPVNTQKLPDFSTMTKVTTVCMDQYAVALRAWTAGFPGIPDLFEWFALRTSTKLIAPVAGTYTFRLNSDDGSKLYINNQLVIDNDGLHSQRAVNGTVTLPAGEHSIVLEYYQGPREHIALELLWQLPDQAGFTLVPRTAFK